MARIPQHFIDDLLARVDIVDVVGQYLPLKKSGSNYSACCPFHNEKTPSFSVSQRKQFFYCFGCGASGNAIGFLMDHDNLSFIEAIETLAEKVGISVPREHSHQQQDNRRPLYKIMQQASQFYQQQLRQHPNANTVIDYLKQRGLSGEIAKQFQMGFAPEGWDNLNKHLSDATDKQLLACGLLTQNEKGKVYDRFRDRIMFPIRDRQGRTIGFGGRVLSDGTPKYLNSPETVIFHKGSELYGLYEALQTHRHLSQLIVVEGYMDVIALAQADITNAVATLGTATTKQNAEKLFRQCSDIVFCFDGDKAGRTAAWRALENILPLLEDGLSVKFMFLPDGEDPDSFVTAHGKTEFLEQLRQAKTLSQFLLNHLVEQTDLTSLDGRSRLAKLAESYIKQIPGQAFQQLLLNELARLTKLQSDELARLYKLTSLNSAEKPAPSSSYNAKPPSVMQQTISILLQYPEKAAELPELAQYHDIDLPGKDIFISLLELLAKAPTITTGAILEHWRDDAIYPMLTKLAQRELLFPESGIVDELMGLLKKLRQLSNKNKLNTWHQKAANGTLSAEEKMQFLALSKAQKQKPAKD